MVGLPKPFYVYVGVLRRLIVGGVDDAGRGSIIGPLVIAGVAVREEDIPLIRGLGVRDSKLLTPDRRFSLAPRIREVAVRVEVRLIEPGEIDSVVGRMPKFRRLNYLEGRVMGEVVARLGVSVAYVDASDVDLERFRQVVEEFSGGGVKVVAEHRAESRYPVVAAASIIAKTERDRVVEELRRTYGEFGTGYPHDPATIDFLRRWLGEKGSIPRFARSSWKTWRRIRSGDLSAYV
jgi:ribonuclease HII